MSRWTAWWHQLSSAAKFRLYSRLAYQAAIVAVLVALATTAASAPAVVVILLGGFAACLAVEAQPEFATVRGQVARPWMLPVGTLILAALWVIGAAFSLLSADESIVDTARAAGGFSTLFAMFAVVPFVRHRWWVMAGFALATAMVFGLPQGEGPRAAFVFLLTGACAVGVTVLTVWGLGIIDELDRAKLVEAELQVAEERLRFARDLHDVVGRGFSAIAVKSELAVALSRSGNHERAEAEMEAVRVLAVESMGQMRTLVRGYRNIDLRGEVAGARSLLSAVGCDLVVEGDAAKVPPRYHEVAAWVVREGTTNIVEHSAASVATLALGDAGMSLRNDRPHAAIGERSGLRGLGERLAAVGATLDVTATGDQFALEIHWEKL
ncbi:sensor histidine kinase [Nocardia neocaledoniensis NBRC 108232]|uniref:Two-component system sensor histidine kinase DesK n=1 Tax=Nocardia neocaledoniensis TaxID=236511 RepID=A0A317N885_9NOCA|nr:histidine kinase [Nocardia neocaledoniensis]PWV71123.1 two-component system sensor histidine kinase DesK [Nocardia neocaledoniensis]GEM30215.1 sensor histidine kinase [Nocardia neocaledoniensis NBRC 108232]